ncbi:MAG TPA: type I 3-dehydroquinate dehydratase [Actinophytocola sp.]|uniref:type I 3-dehydroquinate dehydratase n=1 Tax=Actinophytocola sp. TaxID=1872138 RepID=UPI002DBD9CFC|nr:type I 3-dehydroquinate dehydratase [Actinophytocola sp.]HEU5475953.1 type I 3-dehydroquinate dehydratase [Actinophytocola sp.]
MRQLSSPCSLGNGSPDRTCSIVATLTTTVWTQGRALRALRGVASGLEVRADLTGDIDPDVLRAHAGGELIYTLRSMTGGGAFTGTAEERRRRLLAAARKYDLVDLEYDRDLVPELLAAIPAHRRRICWAGPGRDRAGLAGMFAGMAVTPARQYLLAPEAGTVEEAMAPLHLLRMLGRTDVTAFATGELGGTSRLLAPWLGAPVVYGGLGQNGAHGLLTVERLLRDYPFPALPRISTLYGIVGRRVGESHSPRLHNDGYHTLGLSALFLPLHANEFVRSWRSMCAEFDRLGVPFKGATIVAPYKEDALVLANTVSADANHTGAANLLVRKRNGWRAYTTDPTGVVGAVRDAGIGLVGRRVAVVGCGGAGRGAAAGLLRAGAVPTMVNRGAARGRYAARLLGVDFMPLNRFQPEDYSLVVHATPLKGESPFSVDRVAADAVLVDLAYGPEPTDLVAAARRRGLTVVDGWAVLRAEVAQQFRLMTGRAIPPANDSMHERGPLAAVPSREFAR